MRKTSIFTLILASASLFAYSQDTDDNAFSDALDKQSFSQEAASEEASLEEDESEENAFADALDSDTAVVVGDGKSDARIQKFLDSKGWETGFNEGGRYVAVGSSTVSGTTKDPNFNRNRIIAFNKALLDVKAAIVESFCAEIATLTQWALSSPNSSADLALRSNEAQVDPDFLGDLTSATQKRIDAVIAEGEVKTPEEAADVVISSESFQSLIAAYAQEKVGGLIVSKIFEEDTKISIVAYYSNNTVQLASVLNGRKLEFKVAKNTDLQPSAWVNSLKISEIYPCLGVFATSDKDGNLVLLSFGQAAARSASPTSLKLAYETANLNALGFLRNFAGELVTKSSMAFSEQAMVEFKDGSEISINDDGLDSCIVAFSDALPISGATTAREWSVKDPRNGQIVCGTVKMWSIKSAQFANFNRDLLAFATKNKNGYLTTYPKGKKPFKSNSKSNSKSSSKSTRSLEKTRLSSPETHDF